MGSYLFACFMLSWYGALTGCSLPVCYCWARWYPIWVRTGQFQLYIFYLGFWARRSEWLCG